MYRTVNPKLRYSKIIFHFYIIAQVAPLQTKTTIIKNNKQITVKYLEESPDILSKNVGSQSKKL